MKDTKRKYMCIVVGSDFKSIPVVETYITEHDDNDSRIACERLFKQKYDDVYNVDSYFEDLYVSYNQLGYNMSVVNEIQRIKEENKLKEDEEYKEYQRLRAKFENR